jgi:hypothetical protein
MGDQCKHCGVKLYGTGVTCCKCKARLCANCAKYEKKGLFGSNQYCRDCVMYAKGKIIG